MTATYTHCFNKNIHSDSYNYNIINLIISNLQVYVFVFDIDLPSGSQATTATL